MNFFKENMSSFTVCNGTFSKDIINRMMFNPNHRETLDLPLYKTLNDVRSPNKPELGISARKKSGKELGLIIACPKTIKKQKVFKIRNFLKALRGKRKVEPKKIKFNSKIVELKKLNHTMNLKLQQKFDRLDLFLDKINLALDEKL